MARGRERKQTALRSEITTAALRSKTTTAALRSETTATLRSNYNRCSQAKIATDCQANWKKRGRCGDLMPPTAAEVLRRPEAAGEPHAHTEDHAHADGQGDHTGVCAHVSTSTRSVAPLAIRGACQGCVVCVCVLGLSDARAGACAQVHSHCMQQVQWWIHTFQKGLAGLCLHMHFQKCVRSLSLDLAADPQFACPRELQAAPCVWMDFRRHADPHFF